MPGVRLGSLVDLDRTVVWKAGAGDGNRVYADLLVQHDVFAAGPGEPGPYLAGKPYIFEDTEKRHIRQFYEEVQPGDMFILRSGVWTVHGIGIVQDGGAVFDEAWGDVDGWDLRHVRRVKWVCGPTEVLGKEGFGSQGGTLSRVNDGRLLERLKQVEVEKGNWDRPLHRRPVAGKGLTIDDLCDQLVEHGLGVEQAEELHAVLSRTRRLVKWYEESKLGESDISENETLAYIAIPILLAMGWTHQLLGIEWNGIDAVLFERLPRSEKNVRILVEAKSLRSSLRTAITQGQEYVDSKNLANCKIVVATDGPRWMINERAESGHWETKAYLNLRHPRDSYPVLGEVSGGVEVLQSLQRR